MSIFYLVIVWNHTSVKIPEPSYAVCQQVAASVITQSKSSNDYIDVITYCLPGMYQETK